MKKLKLLLLVCLIPLAGLAQETPEAAKAKIKEAKLSEKYVYAETISTQSLAEAQQNAMDLLRRNVLSLLVEKEGNSQKAEKIWDEMGSQYERQTVVVDSLFRVFLYLPKDRLLPATATATTTTPTPALSEEDFLFEAPKEEETQMDEATIQHFFSQMEMVEAKPQKVDSAIAEKAPVEVETPQPKQEEAVEATPTEAAPVEITPIEAAPVETTPVKVAPPTLAPLQKELQEMLSMKSYKEVMVYLNREKGEGRAIYGRIKTMTAPAKSYLLVVRNGEMVTILDKGAGIRINLKTNQAESIRNYVGYAVIWFQLF